MYYFYHLRKRNSYSKEMVKVGFEYFFKNFHINTLQST